MSIDTATTAPDETARSVFRRAAYAGLRYVAQHPQTEFYLHATADDAINPDVNGPATHNLLREIRGGYGIDLENFHCDVLKSLFMDRSRLGGREVTKKQDLHIEGKFTYTIGPRMAK